MYMYSTCYLYIQRNTYSEYSISLMPKYVLHVYVYVYVYTAKGLRSQTSTHCHINK